jgi:hypothetical protein
MNAPPEKINDFALANNDPHDNSDQDTSSDDNGRGPSVRNKSDALLLHKSTILINVE